MVHHHCWAPDGRRVQDFLTIEENFDRRALDGFSGNALSRNRGCNIHLLSCDGIEIAKVIDVVAVMRRY